MTTERLLEALLNPETQDRATLAAALALDDFRPVYALADSIRKAHKADIVDIRAILEFSNHCRRKCRYCGLNAANRHVERFRIPPDEMVDTVHQAARAGYRTIVLQSGEDAWYTPQILGGIVRRILQNDEIAVTVSCGEMPPEAYAYLKECGADRYLLKHETADPALYSRLHPCGTLQNRIECLKAIKRLGFETGSGFMIGLPGQTLDTIASDLLLLQEIGCDMAGIGPFIPHPETDLRDIPEGSTELCKRAVALARILLPDCNLPATTSLGVIDNGEKNDVFSCGANVVMRKVTPTRYKALYEIYPAKLGETHIEAQRRELEEQIRALGRTPV